jgi:hypothetical protein
MSKLQSIADRAPKIVAALEDRAGKLDERLTKLESTGNGVFDRWDGHVSEQEKAVAVAEDAINRLSNAEPPSTTAASPPAATPPPFRQPGAGGGAPG